MNQSKQTYSYYPLLIFVSLYNFFIVDMNFGSILAHMAENLAEFLHFNHSINILRYESNLSFSSNFIVVGSEWPIWGQEPTCFARCGLEVESDCWKPTECDCGAAPSRVWRCPCSAHTGLIKRQRNQ